MNNCLDNTKRLHFLSPERKAKQNFFLLKMKGNDKGGWVGVELFFKFNNGWNNILVTTYTIY